MDYLELIKNFRDIMSLNQRINKDIAKKHNLLLIDINILSFLHYNPTLGTASDIVEYRGLAKGNVSSSLSKLKKEGMVDIFQDPLDKRLKRIRLNAKADAVLEDIESGLKEISSIITSGIDADSIDRINKLLPLLGNNAKDYLEER